MSSKNGSKAVRILKNPVTKIFILILVVAAVGYGIFILGQRSGAKKQLAIDTKKIEEAKRTSSMFPGLTNPSLTRKTTVGTITKVDDKGMEVAPKTGDKVKIKFDKSTIFTGSDLKKTDVKALKKDQKVIVSSKINDDKSLTAIRVRIQK